MTHTECIYKLRAQQALPARWVICLRKNKEIASLYSFVFSTRKLFATDRHRLNIPSDIPSSCYTALHVYLGGILRLTDTCVFISWDVKCPTSKEWIRTMDIHSLSRGTDQPFNHILTDEGKSRYVAEGNYWNCRYPAANLYINVWLLKIFAKTISCNLC